MDTKYHHRSCDRTRGTCNMTSWAKMAIEALVLLRKIESHLSRIATATEALAYYNPEAGIMTAAVKAAAHSPYDDLNDHPIGCLCDAHVDHKGFSTRKEIK